MNTSYKLVGEIKLYMKNDYTEKLENVIKQMLRPIKNIPFNIVIEAISGFPVIPFDKNDERDRKVLETLIQAVNNAGSEVNEGGILRPRPNEVGNDIESYVLRALNNLGYKADKPSTASGQRRATGYPDIEFIDDFSRINYIECKTYNIKSKSSSFRSFYLSPSESFKVTNKAHHFGVSFEIFVSGTQGENKIYKCKKWIILALENLSIDVKYEFQSDNKRLYSEDLILAEGKFEET